MRDNAPVRLVSTSLIEAGVDVDFPAAWRAMTSLSSIVQTAGRVNREGRRAREESIVTVFDATSVKPPHFLSAEIAVTRAVLRSHRADPIAPDAVEAYFSQLYWRRSQTPNGLDVMRIMPRLEERRSELLFPFEDIEQDFRIIDETMIPVIIPYDEEARSAIADLEVADHVGSMMRTLQRYTVGIPEADLGRLIAENAVTYVAEDRWGDQFPMLADMTRYSEEVGLDLWS